MTPMTPDTQYASAAWKESLLTAAYHEVDHLPGDLAEFGVYHGHNVRSMARIAPDHTVWAFDTFAGMPREDYSTLNDEDASDPPGKWASEATPDVLFAGYPNVKVMQGRFVDTLPQVDPDVRFILAHIDCDWYHSHVQVLGWLAQHLTPGAILIFDDPTLGGAQRAIAEWVAANPGKMERQSESRYIWRGGVNS